LDGGSGKPARAVVSFVALLQTASERRDLSSLEALYRRAQRASRLRLRDSHLRIWPTISPTVASTAWPASLFSGLPSSQFAWRGSNWWITASTRNARRGSSSAALKFR